MTLRDFFDYLGEHPLVLVAYFLVIPLTAMLAGWISRGEGHLSPWKYLYSFLVYAVCIPGIFSVTLSIYLFLFERGGSILNTNILTQVMPVVSMFLTLAVIRRNAPFEHIPGFGKLSSLMMTIGAVFMLMYLLDRTHLIAFVRVPVQYLLLIVVGMLLVLRYGFRQMIS
jgi:amino acid transporter